MEGLDILSDTVATMTQQKTDGWMTQPTSTDIFRLRLQLHPVCFQSVIMPSVDNF